MVKNVKGVYKQANCLKNKNLTMNIINNIDKINFFLLCKNINLKFLSNIYGKIASKNMPNLWVKYNEKINRNNNICSVCQICFLILL